MKISGRYSAGIAAFLTAAVSTAALADETIDYNYDALGRLIISQSDGTVNDDETRSLCYDDAGNRIKFTSDDSAAVASCAPAFIDMPTPVANTNTPPTTVDDYVSLYFWNTPQTVDVLGNDSDPDGDTPLVVTSVAMVSGGASVTLTSGGDVVVSPAPFAQRNTTSWATYVVTDARGAISTGQLEIYTQ